MTQVEQDIIQRINLLDRRLEKIEKLLIAKKPIRTWVKISVITELTGWDYRTLKKARENKLVEFKENEGKFIYLLESQSEIFIKR